MFDHLEEHEIPMSFILARNSVQMHAFIYMN